MTVQNRVYVGHSCCKTYPARAHVHVYVREATSAFMLATRVAKRKRSELTSTSTSGRTTFAARRTHHISRGPHAGRPQGNSTPKQSFVVVRISYGPKTNSEPDYGCPKSMFFLMASIENISILAIFLAVERFLHLMTFSLTLIEPID